VAYDQELADRIRLLIGDDPRPIEKKMFGGLAFLIGGHMAITASRQGGIMVHVSPEECETLIATAGAVQVEMRGRTMPGWVRVSSDELGDDDQLKPWIERGLGYARSLPPKQ
jgi:hypothetical protein